MEGKLDRLVLENTMIEEDGRLQQEEERFRNQHIKTLF